jgi:hypothetical protein
MGLTVEEYFAQKEACTHCAEHGNEEHCVTTLLSRKENCFVYNITHYGIGDNVDYYVRCDKLISKMGILEKPYHEQISIYSGINYRYIREVVFALTDNEKEKAKHIINTMLKVLETENNISKELNDYDNY